MLRAARAGVRRSDEPRPCLRHHNRNIQQVIKMSVRHQNGVRRRRRLEFRVYAAFGRDAMPPKGGTPSMRLRELTQTIVDAGRVWLNARTKCDAQKVYAREVRIDQ